MAEREVETALTQEEASHQVAGLLFLTSSFSAQIHGRRTIFRLSKKAPVLMV